MLLFYGGREEDPPFLDSGRFLPIVLGKDDSYFGKGDSFFPLCNHLPDITTIKRTSLFCRKRRCKLMNELTLVKWRSGWQLRLGELSLGKISARANQAVRAMKSPSARAEGWPGTRGPANVWPNPLEISGWRVGPLFVDRLMFGPFPLEVLGLIWRVRGVGPGP